MARVVIDASTLVAALLPGEPTERAARKILERFAEDELELIAPTLLAYEVANSLLKAERKLQRGVSEEAIDAILGELSRLGIPLIQVSMEEMVSMARRSERWAYDASYLALAEREGIPLITSDKRLYNAVRERFDKVVWVEDYVEEG